MLDFERLRNGNALQREEGELLYALVLSIKPQLCVETGTHKSLSSHYIAQALKENFEALHNEEADKPHLHTCDIKDWGVMEGDKFIAHSPLAEWMTFHLSAGKDLKIDGKIDFLFIDGDHHKYDVEGEVDNFWPMLAEEAIVVFHDCRDPELNSDDADVNGGVKSRGLDTVLIPTFNRMRIYFHGKDSTKRTKKK